MATCARGLIFSSAVMCMNKADSSTFPSRAAEDSSWSPAAGHKEAHEAGEHAYAWRRLHRDGLDYLPRAWSTGNKCFLPQRIDIPSGEKGHTAVLGDHVEIPRSKLPESIVQWLTRSASRTAAARSTDTIAGPALFAAGTHVSTAPTEPTAPTQPIGAKYDPSKAHFYVPYSAASAEASPSGTFRGKKSCATNDFFPRSRIKISSAEEQKQEDLRN